MITSGINLIGLLHISNTFNYAIFYYNGHYLAYCTKSLNGFRILLESNFTSNYIACKSIRTKYIIQMMFDEPYLAFENKKSTIKKYYTI